MFKFFDLPKEMQLEILSHTSIKDQAMFAQVSKLGNQIANDHTLALDKYKHETIARKKALEAWNKEYERYLASQTEFYTSGFRYF